MSPLMSMLYSQKVIDRHILTLEIQAFEDKHIDDIGSIRTYHTLLDQLVKVIQSPDAYAFRSGELRMMLWPKSCAGMCSKLKQTKRLS